LDLRANRLFRFRRSAAGEVIATEGGFGMISLDALPGIAVNLAPLVTPEG
jgi:hypothetical protein